MPAKPLDPRQLKDAQRLNAAFKHWQAQRRANGQGASQRYAAELMGFGQSALSQYLTGKIPLNGEALAKFARLFGVAPESISPEIVSEQRALSVTLGESEGRSSQSRGVAAGMPKVPSELLERALAMGELTGRTAE